MDRMIYKYGYKINAKRLEKKDKWYCDLYSAICYGKNDRYFLTWNDDLESYVVKEWRPFQDSREFHSKVKKRKAGVRRSKRKTETAQIVKEALNSI